jgi:cytoskeletal protein CcmA (bactofilin family)
MEGKNIEYDVSSNESIIASGTRIRGKIIEAAGVCISGSLEGEIECRGRVRITREGEVKGLIKAPSVLIEGKLNGNIESADRVEIKAAGRISGNIQTQKIVIDEGSILHGQVRMSKEIQGHIEPPQK